MSCTESSCYTSAKPEPIPEEPAPYEIEEEEDEEDEEDDYESEDNPVVVNIKNVKFAAQTRQTPTPTFLAGAATFAATTSLFTGFTAIALTIVAYFA